MSEEKNTPSQDSESYLDGHREKSSENKQTEKESQPAEKPETRDQKPETLSQSQTSNLKSETTDMETHAHHLHKAPGKKFWHYFFEFFMLFLAVFCGFLAENLREQAVELRREKQFMLSLLHDLKEDTSAFKNAISGYTNSNKKIDSLITLLKDPARNKWTGQIYYFAKWIVFDQPYVAVNKTYEQMKSSGNLRLVHDTNLLDRLGAYYYYFDNTLKLGPPQMQFEVRHDLFMLYDKVFDASVFQKMISPPTDSFTIVMMPQGNPPLITDDAVVINEMCMRLHNLYFVRRVIINQARNFLKRATDLIKEIEEEYHLK